MNLPTESSVADELGNKSDFMTFELASIRAIQLVGLLQLALRHPALLDSDSEAFGRVLIGHARAYFADCPAILALIDCGDDPRFDVR